MPRHLTRQQKKLLSQWFHENKDNIGMSFDVEDKIFPNVLYHKICQLNDFETINQAMNAFILDLLALEF